MKCKECEPLIFTYRELSDQEKVAVDLHIQSCGNCTRLFSEMQNINQLLARAASTKSTHNHPAWLTNKIMGEVANSQTETPEEMSWLLIFSNLSIVRYGLATASCALLILFAVEIMEPEINSENMSVPITSLKGVVLKSKELRKIFSARKEKKTPFSGCRNILTNQVDQACVKEKIEKLNF